MGSVVPVPGFYSTELSFSEARGIFLNQGLDLCLLHWQMDSLPLEQLRKPHYCFLMDGQTWLSVWNLKVGLLNDLPGCLKPSALSGCYTIFLIYLF